MRTIISVVSVVMLCQCAMAESSITVPVEVAKEVETLLAALPPQSSLWRSYNLSMNSAPESNGDKARLSDDSATVKLAHEVVPKIRKLLKVGASIFAYPRILAHGDITYQSIGDGNPFASGHVSEYGYRLYVGLPGGRLRHAYDFEILFDLSGIIREINDVRGKE